MKTDEFERTIAHGEIAIKYLKANITPAYPRNYELWYTYSTGVNRDLNRAINEALRAGGKLTPAQTDKIYEDFISSGMLSERIGQVSGRLTDQVVEIIEALEKSGGSVGQFGKELRQATNGLGSAKSGEEVRTIVETIVKATHKMEGQNSDLERQLRESQAQIEELHSSLESIRFESLTDQLTGLANRKRFDESLRKAINEAEETGNPLCLAMADVDHFKKFNDTFGHQTGDQVLRLVAATMKSNVKGRDTAARYGGEEFGLIMPATSLEAGRTVCDQIRQVVRAKELVKRSTGESLGRITISFGIALFRSGEPVESLIERADEALYAAKRAGRDRVLTELECSKEAVA